MAIFGSLATVRAQLGQQKRFESAFAYLDDALHPGSAANTRLLQLVEGKSDRVELADGAFALEQVYQTKARADGFFESHRVYIDVQVVVSGEEFIEVADVGGLQVKEDRTPGKDVIIYHMTNQASVLRLKAGDAAVLYPVDGHMPSISTESPSTVRKIVVKVPAA
jgi:biofilm protein TabA